MSVSPLTGKVESFVRGKSDAESSAFFEKCPCLDNLEAPQEGQKAI